MCQPFVKPEFTREDHPKRMLANRLKLGIVQQKLDIARVKHWSMKSFSEFQEDNDWLAQGWTSNKASQTAHLTFNVFERAGECPPEGSSGLFHVEAQVIKPSLHVRVIQNRNCIIESIILALLKLSRSRNTDLESAKIGLFRVNIADAVLIVRVIIESS
jgi:hypothetical protein